MSAFAELDWRRIDVSAIVTSSGLATIEEERHAPCRDWLIREGYQIDTFDCRRGLEVAIPALGRLLQWEAQFGYSLGPTDRNLDALRDGFHFDPPAGGARLLEMLRPDVIWKEDPRWLCGLLAIIQEHTRYQLALGNRFFALLVVPAGSPPHRRDDRAFGRAGSALAPWKGMSWKARSLVSFMVIS